MEEVRSPWVSRICSSLERFWQAPFSIRKIWFCFCGLIWAIFVISLLIQEPFSGALLAPFSLFPLWVSANIFDWIGFALSPGSVKGNGGKSV